MSADAYESTVFAKLEVPNTGLSAAALQAWLEHIPPTASITVSMVDTGTQRDPEIRLQSVHARWDQPL